jgi:hypothetical protein
MAIIFQSMVTASNHHPAPSCTIPRDTTASSDNSTRRTRRLPDGSGDWDTPSGNSSPSTEGESNVTPQAGSGTLSIADATAAQGSNMVFNLSLTSNPYAVANDQVAIGTITVPVSTVDHYRFEYDGSAVTCATETVIVKACANADCSTLYGSQTSLQL